MWTMSVKPALATLLREKWKATSATTVGGSWEFDQVLEQVAASAVVIRTELRGVENRHTEARRVIAGPNNYI